MHVVCGILPPIDSGAYADSLIGREQDIVPRIYAGILSILNMYEHRGRAYYIVCTSIHLNMCSVN